MADAACVVEYGHGDVVSSLRDVAFIARNPLWACVTIVNRLDRNSRMQSTIRIAGLPPDVGAIENAIRALDPSALVDIDPAGQTLRIAASIGAVQLLGAMKEAGYPVKEDQLERVPSECCGGCGG